MGGFAPLLCGCALAPGGQRPADIVKNTKSGAKRPTILSAQFLRPFYGRNLLYYIGL